MQAQTRIKFTLAKLPSKNFIYFKRGRNTNYGVFGQLPIISYDIKVEQPRPDVNQLRTAPFTRSTRKYPMLVSGTPTLTLRV